MSIIKFRTLSLYYKLLYINSHFSVKVNYWLKYSV